MKYHTVIDYKNKDKEFHGQRSEEDRLAGKIWASWRKYISENAAFSDFTFDKYYQKLVYINSDDITISYYSGTKNRHLSVKEYQTGSGPLKIMNLKLVLESNKTPVDNLAEVFDDLRLSVIDTTTNINSSD